MAVREQERTQKGLKWVARLAGTSPATVSRVINSRPGVRPELRRVVEDVIREHGLELNVAARALKTSKTRTLAIIIPRSGSLVFANPYFTEILGGITAVTEDAGYTLAVMTGATPNTLYEVNRNRSCDGVLFIGLRKNIPDPRSLRGATVPVVTIPKPGPRYKLPFVTVDDETGTYEAVRYLVGRGHRRIALVIGSPSSPFSTTRVAGYRRALKDAGLPYVPALVADGEFTDEGAHRVTLGLLGLSNPPTAILAISDHMATGVLSALQSRRLRVPSDVALVGFGNTPVSGLLSPSLTTVDEQLREVGAQAASLLIRLAEGEAVEATQMVVPTKLVVRESA